MADNGIAIVPEEYVEGSVRLSVLFDAYARVLASRFGVCKHFLDSCSLTPALPACLISNRSLESPQSVLGGYLDPLADKIMVTTVALALGQEGIIPAALVVRAGNKSERKKGAAEVAEDSERRERFLDRVGKPTQQKKISEVAGWFITVRQGERICEHGRCRFTRGRQNTRRCQDRCVSTLSFLSLFSVMCLCVCRCLHIFRP